VANTFYDSTPDALFWPTFVLALAASVIGSQAMISCAFATISHSQAMGCFPRVKVLHTSRQYQGQLYIPEVNLLLAVAACVVTLAAKITAVIAEAHGICVVLVMLITTLLLKLVMLLVWRVNAAWVAFFFAVFVASESVYLSSVLYRFAHGGYIPVAMSAALMVLWHYVHVKRYQYELERTVSHESVRELLAARGSDDQQLVRVPGVGLFYTELVQGIPPVFPHLVEKIPSIDAVLLFVSVKHLPVPYVDARWCPLLPALAECSVPWRATATGTASRRPRTSPPAWSSASSTTSATSTSTASTRPPPMTMMARARSGVFAEEMLTPAESFSELCRMGSMQQQQAAVKMSLEEMARIEEEQRFIQREMDKGVVYIMGETEVVARPNSSLLKKVLVNYAYAFLRKNCRQGEKMLAIPKSQLLKVGMPYEI
jgi:KUP system potassium uptake protein